MMVSMKTLKGNETLRMALHSDGLAALENEPAFFDGTAKTYSEVNTPLHKALVCISESLTMLSFTEQEDEADQSVLTKATWSHFVNLDQISSVILHSERVMDVSGKEQQLPPASCSGPWITINGPRVGWNKRLQTSRDAEGKRKLEAIGAKDGNFVGAALAKGEHVRWFRIELSVRAGSVSVPDLGNALSDDGELLVDEPRKPARSGKGMETFMVINILGRQFTSPKAAGEHPDYRGHFVVEVPVSFDDQALAAFDLCEVGIDLREHADDPKLVRTVWATKLPLWKLFAGEDRVRPKPAIDSVRATAFSTLGLDSGEDEAEEDVVSLAKAMSGGNLRNVKDIQLVHPTMDSTDEIIAKARMQLEVLARVHDAPSSDRRCISPELQGRGSVTSLYTANRGAWFDPKDGVSKMASGALASFVELNIKELIFPKEDRSDTSRLYRYQVEARCNGVTSACVPVVRAKDMWSHIVPTDSSKINFAGARIFVPLPPGAWCHRTGASRHQVELIVSRCVQTEVPTFSWRELISNTGKSSSVSAGTWETCYHASLSVDGLAMDHTNEAFSVLLSPAATSPSQVVVANGEQSPVDVPAVVVLDCTLRDRDTVRFTSASDKDFNNSGVICVGDKAMLKVEEPLSYPANDVEFRRRCLPGEFDKNSSKKAGMAWTAPLRDPSMSHEYKQSGLEKLEKPPGFKQRYLPNNCEDVIPYKYVLPMTEADFIRNSRPGVFWRILEDYVLAEGGSEARKAPATPKDKYPPVIVERLSHLQRQIPVTVLAVYADGSCDVEFSPAFLSEWESKPFRTYTIPGSIAIGEFNDTSAAAIRSAPVGAGDIGERLRRRVLLKGVHLNMLQSVQAASFNIYDATLGSVDDALKLHPNKIGNDYNPRLSGLEYTDERGAPERGSYRVHAGPVPGDAGPSCTYEWSVSLCTKSEDDMYQFVTQLRQAVRMCLYQQLSRLDEYKKKSAQSALHSRPFLNSTMLSSNSGNLEVVLVEAKHLRPQRVQVDKDLSSAAMRLANFEPAPKAVFTLFDVTKFINANGEEQEKYTEVVYKGSKTQSAPQLSGSNPNWSEQEGLQSSNGWVFKTPPIEPNRMRNMYLQIEIISKAKRVGLMRMPVCGFDSIRDPRTAKAAGSPGEVADWGQAPKVTLTDPEEPFRNIWVPLSSMKLPQQGEAYYPWDMVPNPSGELHIMTLWVPQQPTARMMRFPKTIRGWRALELKQRLQRAALYNPIYEIQIMKKGYDPNLSQGSWPPTPYEANAQHVQRITDCIPYVDCIARQQMAAWGAFDTQLRSAKPAEAAAEAAAAPAAEQPIKSLNEFRDEWAKAIDKQENADLMYKMDDLVRRGVPTSLRRHVWMELLRADTAQAHVPEKYKAGSLLADADEPKKAASREFYKKLVEHGKPYRNDAMWQLNEDLVGAAAWEDAANPAIMDRHLRRLKRAQDVCIALIAFSRDLGDGKRELTAPPDYSVFNEPGRPPAACGIAYCESLLVLAFFLIVAQTPNDLGKAEKKTMNQMLEEEVRAFWILFAMIGAPGPQTYRAYYGVPTKWLVSGGALGDASEYQIADEVGVMEDVQRLNYCLARWEPALWVHLNALGFHLSTVFYGAFSRLYAFMLPISTLFRFWDFVFAQASRPDLASHKPARHPLIDLAFASLQKCKTTLMACQSATEVKNCIVHFIENIYDPSEVIELAHSAERYLWDDPSHLALIKTVGFPLHSMDYNRSVEFWEAHLRQYKEQNRVLMQIVWNSELGASGGAFAGNNNINQMAPTQDIRVTTRSVMKIINSLRQQFYADGAPKGQFGGMMRQMAPKLLELGPEVDQSYVGQAFGFAKHFYEHLTHQANVPLRAVGVPPPPNSEAEPAHLDQVTWNSQIRKCVGDAWSNHISKMFELFASNVGEKRFSLNEFLIALICCSKGTLGEKAIALFHLYAYVQPPCDVPHVLPVSHAAGTIIEKNEGYTRQDEGTLIKAPKLEEVKKMALHFEVYVFAGGAMGDTTVLLGEVFIPTLTPYIYSGMGVDIPRTYTIWGKPKALPPGVFANSRTGVGGGNTLLSDEGVRPYMGDIELAIKWMPESPEKPEVGQLGIHLYSIKFNSVTVEAPKLKNPKVTVSTYADGQAGEFRKEKIRRWDPRTASRKMSNAIMNRASIGEFVEFEEPMRRNPATGGLSAKPGAGHHGWDTSEDRLGGQCWKWSNMYGDQYSVPRSAFRKEVCTLSSSVAGNSAVKPNTISLQACRLLVESILHRSLHPVTHRQSALIADQVFNRAGAVPGILDAILVQGDAGNAPSIAEAKAEYDKVGKKWVDVKQQVLLAHELQVAINRGDINLLPASMRPRGGEHLDLYKVMKITDPFPGERKVLWIRFCRSGDGQRMSTKIAVEPDGVLTSGEILLDMDHTSQAGQVQMSVTKEEFVNCLISSPILSESIRQLATADNSTRNVPAGTPIKLDVVIADPTKDEADEDLMDAMNARQGVLLEIWDADTGKTDDFLGECWLPPLGSIGTQPRRFALEVVGFQPDGSLTRKDSRKGSAADKVAEGSLFVEASWNCPLEEVPDLPEGTTDLATRAKHMEKLHTGVLTLKIIRAEGLRTADRSFRRAGSDPYVCVYIKNEAFMMSQKGKIPAGFDADGWHHSQVTGFHEIFFQTKTQKATRDPEFNEETTITLMTGAFEKRTKQAYHLSLTNRQDQRFKDDHLLAILGDKEELRIHFGSLPSEAELKAAKRIATLRQNDPEYDPKAREKLQDIETQMKEKADKPGHRHRVQVFLGESMHQFKDKLVEACLKEAELEKDPKIKSQFQAVAHDMSFRHAVMVFVPSKDLRELAQQGRTSAYEYKRLYRIEEQDPSSWQPLDTICTFQHYAAMYSFGRAVAQRLRICDGTSTFKLKNSRFRVFDQEQERWRKRLQDLNSNNQCFGYAKFLHTQDAGSFEWRQALLDRPEQGAEGTKKKYKASFVHSPLTLAEHPHSATSSGQFSSVKTQEVEEDALLLGPLHPLILGSAFMEHKELLAKAHILKEKGMKDDEIVKTLNEELNLNWQKSLKDADETEGTNHQARPPQISMADVLHATKADEEKKHGQDLAAAQGAPARALG